MLNHSKTSNLCTGELAFGLHLPVPVRSWSTASDVHCHSTGQSTASGNQAPILVAHAQQFRTLVPGDNKPGPGLVILPEQHTGRVALAAFENRTILVTVLIKQLHTFDHEHLIHVYLTADLVCSKVLYRISYLIERKNSLHTYQNM